MTYHEGECSYTRAEEESDIRRQSSACCQYPPSRTSTRTELGAQLNCSTFEYTDRARAEDGEEMRPHSQ